MPALLELVVQSSYNGEQCINRWNYITSSTPAAVSFSFALVSAFGGIVDSPDVVFPDDTVMSHWQAMVDDGVVFQNIQARNIYSVTDFYDTPIPTGVYGLVTGSDGSPEYVSFGFISSRVRQDIRRATKRLAGVPEASTANFGALTGGSLTLAENLAAAMSVDLTYDDEGSPVVFSPCVVHKEKYVAPSGKDAYRYYLPVDEAEQFANLATSITWTPYANTRSQVSRQKGRGR